MAIPEADIHKGHRQRMRRKFREHKARAFDTYELLEMLLYHVIPYKDTNPVSKNLLFECGSLDAVFKAGTAELVEIDGVGAGVAEFIARCEALMRLAESSDVECGRECFDDFERTGKYLCSFASSLERGITAMMLLDNRMNLIDTAVIYSGKPFSSGGVRADAFLDYAIKNRASVAITAYSREGGALFPSVGDRETSKLIGDALSGAGITYLEHYIVSRDDFIGTVHYERFRVRQSAEIERFLSSKEAYRNG